ncbi:DNA modification system-associated small protein [uncultured Desulfovibrio sp.]|uniref:DNA modification system-associated small protein n=1 Tax=uncultured Desulfovibrio sp. TaxID=167968 RepID=UPI0025DAEC35|nr:DNA modification system-associated small protein [uncultured Desulfovibrio sp.]
MRNFELKDLPLWSDSKSKELFEKMCEEEGIPPQQITELVSKIREYQHMDRARGIYDEFDSILNQGSNQ